MRKPNGVPMCIDALRNARDRAGLTQVQLAVKAGVSIATVQVAERGARMSAETSAKIARALGLEPAELRS